MDLRPVGRGGARRRTRRRHNRRDSGGSNAADTSSSDALDEIEKLAELHKQGILTDEEFEKKKKEILKKV